MTQQVPSLRLSNLYVYFTLTMVVNRVKFKGPVGDYSTSELPVHFI